MNKQQNQAMSFLPQQTEHTHKGRIITDPQGSYTGRPEEPAEEPVQDVDDL